MQKKLRNNFWIFLIVLCCLPALLGIIHKGFFVSDDGHWMVIRLSAFYEALASGQFPVRFLPRLNQGLGYPVADFLYPLFLYIGSFLHVLKISFLDSVKSILVVSIAASGIGIYLFLRRYFNNFPSFIASIFYIYLPYHLYDVYTRGSVGEILALAIVPFLFWSIEKRSWLFAGLFLGLLIPAHNTLALLFLPVAISFAYLKNKSLTYIVFFVSLGLGLAAFFWLPALLDRQFTVFDSVAVSNPFAYFVDTVSFQLVGWIGLVVFVSVFAFRSFFQKCQNIFFFCVESISLVLSFSISSALWHYPLLATFVQFPFRFLSLTIFAQTFLAAFLIEKVRKNITIVVLFIVFLGFSSLPYLFPKQYDYQPDSFYATNVGTTTVQNEYMPVWAKRVPSTYVFNRVSVKNGNATVTNLLQKGTKLSFVVDAKTYSELLISFVYFPGWQVQIDGRKMTISPSSPDGLLKFQVGPGIHTILATYKETGINLFADIISLLAVVMLVAFGLKNFYEK